MKKMLKLSLSVLCLGFGWAISQTPEPVVLPTTTPAPAVTPAVVVVSPVGGTSFTCPGDNTLKFHESWKLGEPGKGWVKFKASGKAAIQMAFSSFPELQGEGYKVVIGSGGNTASTIDKYPESTAFKPFVLDINKGGNPDGVMTGGLPGDGTKLEDYWVSLDNGTVTYGKGTVVGTRELGRATDATPLKYVQYVGFGNGGSATMSFKDIEFSKIVPVEIAINLPEGFEAEEGKVKRISVGSKNGELEVWSVGFDAQLYRYDTYSMSPLPWVKQEFKDAAGVVMRFDDVSVSSDGMMVALGEKGNALRFDWTTKAWTAIAPGAGNELLDFEFITVGKNGCIWAVDSDEKDIYELTNTGWAVRVDGFGSYVAAGVDGTVVGLNIKGEAFRFENGKWIEMPGVLFERVAVGNADHIIGSTDKDNALFQWKDGKWMPLIGKDGKPATGLDEISINAAGTTFGADEDGDVYHKGEAGVAIVVPAPAVIEATTAQAIKTIDALLAGTMLPADIHPSVLPTLKAMPDMAPLLKPAPKVVAAKPGAKPAAKPAAKKVVKPTAAQVKKAVTAAKTTITKAAPKKAAATRATAKKAGTVKAKVVKKKTTGTGKAVKKAAKVKKTVAKVVKVKAKAAAKTVKKAAVKKAAVKKPAAKKPAAKKPAVKKPAAKKPVVKKPAASKPVAKPAAPQPVA